MEWSSKEPEISIGRWSEERPFNTLTEIEENFDRAAELKNALSNLHQTVAGGSLWLHQVNNPPEEWISAKLQIATASLKSAIS